LERADQSLRTRSGRVSASRLRRLGIRDVALIARAEIAFSEGLTVFTGETGSGKTMLLGALAFVLGDRANASLVRTGAERARVCLEIEPDAELRAWCDAAGFPVDANEDVVLLRELAANGKSAARIAGVPASAAQVRELASRIAEFASQHEHRRLFSTAYQLEVLDRFAGPEALARRAEIAALHATCAELRERLAAENRADERTAAELDYARDSLAAIDALAPQPGEDERLRERRDAGANAERIAAALATAHGALADADGAIEALGGADRALDGIARFGAAFGVLAQTIRALQSDATDCAAAIAREVGATEFDPRELDELSERLDTLERLKKRFGGTTERVLAARERFAAALDADGVRDERRASRVADLRTAEERLGSACGALTALRGGAGDPLARRVEAELAALAMPAARFAVAATAVDPPSATGAERVEFLLAPNPGEPARPLARTASGGELSRVLLALTVALADRLEATTLVFDEVDAGIGGAAATAVAVRLAGLARATQVVCVTHLAQIAAAAQRHYVLRKHESGGETRIEVEEPTGAEVDAEIARMLSGADSPTARAHARELLSAARPR